jgi:hypothetical protein
VGTAVDDVQPIGVADAGVGYLLLVLVNGFEADTV